MTDRLTMVNRGRSLVGASRLTDELAEASLTSMEVYDAVVEDILSRRDWSFSTPVAQLARLTAAPGPDSVWSYQYQLPSDRIGPLKAVYASTDWCRPFTVWELRDVGDGTRLLTNAETIFARYPRLTSMQHWPGYFRMLMAKALAAHFALSIREDQALHLRLMMLVFGDPSEGGMGGLLADAATADSQGRPHPVLAMEDGPLIEARGSSYAWDTAERWQTGD